MGRRLPYLWPKDKEAQDKVLEQMKKDLQQTQTMNRIMFVTGVSFVLFLLGLYLIKNL